MSIHRRMERYTPDHGGVMGGVIGRVLPLALGAAVSPTLIAGLILTLADPRRPLARGVALTVGAAIPLLVVLVVLTVLWRPPVSHGTTRNHAVTAAIDLALGVLLLILLVLRLRTILAARRARAHGNADAPPAAAAQKPDEAHPHRSALLGSALFGAGMMMINASTLVLFFAAIKEIYEYTGPLLGRLVAGAVLFVITLLPLLVVLGLYAMMPETAGRLLRPVGTWCKRHENAIAMVVFLIFGLYLVVHGIVRLRN